MARFTSVSKLVCHNPDPECSFLPEFCSNLVGETAFPHQECSGLPKVCSDLVGEISFPQQDCSGSPEVCSDLPEENDFPSEDFSNSWRGVGRECLFPVQFPVIPAGVGLAAKRREWGRRIGNPFCQVRSGGLLGPLSSELDQVLNHRV